MIGDKRKRKHVDIGHVPSFTKYQPLPDSAGLHLPTRIRQGADREITHEVVQAAIRKFKKQGGVIRKALPMFPQIGEEGG